MAEFLQGVFWTSLTRKSITKRRRYSIEGRSESSILSRTHFVGILWLYLASGFRFCGRIDVSFWPLVQMVSRSRKQHAWKSYHVKHFSSIRRVAFQLSYQWCFWTNALFTTALVNLQICNRQHVLHLFGGRYWHLPPLTRFSCATPEFNHL